MGRAEQSGVEMGERGGIVGERGGSMTCVGVFFGCIGGMSWSMRMSLLLRFCLLFTSSGWGGVYGCGLGCGSIC